MNLNSIWHKAFAANLKAHLATAARVLEIGTCDPQQSICRAMAPALGEFVEVDDQAVPELVRRFGPHSFDAVFLNVASVGPTWTSMLEVATNLIKPGGILAVLANSSPSCDEAGPATNAGFKRLFAPLGPVLFVQRDSILGLPDRIGVAVECQLDQDSIADWVAGWVQASSQLTDLPDTAHSNLAPRAMAMRNRCLIAERDAIARELKIVNAERDQLEAELGAVMAERNWTLSREKKLLNSASWRYTRPARVAGRLIGKGLKGEDGDKLFDIARLVGRRMPGPVRTTVHSCKRAGMWLLRAGQRNALKRRDDQPFSDIKPAEKLSTAPDYVMFGLINWHFRHQRPQQLAQAIRSSGRRVFYINNKLFDSPQAGFKVEALDDTGRLFCISLHLHGAPSIYNTLLQPAQLNQLRLGLVQMMTWAGIVDQIAVVQHAFWAPLALGLPDARIVYDCMDHHEGFGGVPTEILEAEQRLLHECDLTVTTSDYLDELVASQTPNRTIIRNAAEFAHFATPPTDLYRDPKGRRIIGYYGAIAEWFDVELVGALAAALPDFALVLVGNDTVGAGATLAKHANVVMLGEIPYAKLPRVAHAFDVCLLPFKVVPLTLATNPVKVYEFLAMGKPVVAVDLPEMQQFGALCRVAGDRDSFITAVSAALSDYDDQSIAVRQAFAREQSWTQRATALIAEAESAELDPLVSVIVVTYNNLALTQQCLASIEQYSHYANLEVIVVDNASSDGSPAWLQQWVEAGSQRRLILNNDNRGFAAANNQGLAIAGGEYLVMLNNDTHVTPGWVRTLRNHLRHNPGLGLIGPVTNNIGNEAKITLHYTDMEQMLECSAAYTRSHIGELTPLRCAAFFCVMLPRSTYQRVGPLDEVFGRGFFEDDDYCQRVEQLGLRIACADDVFVHHQLSASFNLLHQQDRQQLFENNKRIYEQKWGSWVPHQLRAYG